MRLPAIWIFLATAVVGCFPASRGAEVARPLRVLTSFLPIHSLALGVAGERAEVNNWLPPGVDPHEFQFSPRDLRRLKEADVLILAGLGLEGWSGARLRELSGNPSLKIAEAATGIPGDQLIHEPCASDGHEGHETSAHAAHPAPPSNPHFWLDPRLAAHAVTNILEALRGADPAGSAAYAHNAAAVVARLEALNRDFEQALADGRKVPFITYHNAFPYLARRYQLRLVGVVEPIPEQSPMPRQLAELSRLARQEGVRVLFVDGSPTRLARQLAADLRLQLTALETLETGEFGPDAYDQGMRRNLATLKAALAPR